MRDAMTPDEREPKLPRWAQETIDRLRRTVQDRDAHIAGLQHEGPQDTDTVASPFFHEVPLPNGETVRFTVAPPHDYIDVRVRRGVLDLMGSTQVTVRPRSSNSLTVMVEP